MKKLVEYLYKLLSWTSPWGAIGVVCAATATLVTTGLGYLGEVHTWLVSLNVAMGSQNFGAYYGKVNRVFPLGEFLAFIAALLSAKALAFFFRVVWHKIPFFGR